MPDQPGLIHAGWIWDANAWVFCEILASLVGYEFDDLDWQAVGTALPNTDDERAELWYSYPLIGTKGTLEVTLAQAVGGSEVSVEVRGEADDALRACIALVCDLAARYEMSR